jgi:hypothetical protein
VPFIRMVQASSGVIAVYVEDQFEQAAITALRQVVFKVDDGSKL